jgi:hypothetical protein
MSLRIILWHKIIAVFIITVINLNLAQNDRSNFGTVTFPTENLQNLNLEDIQSNPENFLIHVVGADISLSDTFIEQFNYLGKNFVSITFDIARLSPVNRPSFENFDVLTLNLISRDRMDENNVIYSVPRFLERTQPIVYLSYSSSPYLDPELPIDNDTRKFLVEYIDNNRDDLFQLSQSTQNHSSDNRLSFCGGALLAFNLEKMDVNNRQRLASVLSILNKTVTGDVDNIQNARSILGDGTNANVVEVGGQQLLAALQLPSGTQPIPGSSGDIAIVILDTGVNFDDVNQKDFTGIKKPGDIYDKDNVKLHGHIIAELVRQVAPNVDIISARVCNAGGECFIPHILQGICYAVEQAGDDDDRRLILNMSFGTPDENSRSIFLGRIINEALDAGIFVAAGAGNKGRDRAAQQSSTEQYDCRDASGNETRPFYPALGWYTENTGQRVDLTGLIAVDAVQQRNNAWEVASLSVGGDYVTTFAPGSCLNVSSSMTPRSGTSFSTGLISGVLALMIEASEGKLTPVQAKNCLTKHHNSLVKFDNDNSIGIPNVQKIIEDIANKKGCVNVVNGE